jgi:hypothetical protein
MFRSERLCFLTPDIRNFTKTISSVLGLLLCASHKMFTLICWERLFPFFGVVRYNFVYPTALFIQIQCQLLGVLTKILSSFHQLLAYVAENALVFLRNDRKESHTFYESIGSIVGPSVWQFQTN